MLFTKFIRSMAAGALALAALGAHAHTVTNTPLQKIPLLSAVCAPAHEAQVLDAPEENAFVYGDRASGATINPYKFIDPDGRFIFLAAAVPYVVGAVTAAVAAHYAAPGREGREQSMANGLRSLANAVKNESAEAPAQSDKPKADVERDKQRYFDRGQRQRAQDRSKDSDGDPTCEYCGVKTTNEPGKKNSAQTDHITPWVEDGKTTDENANNSCASCNPSKGKKELGTEWIPPKERPPASPSN